MPGRARSSPHQVETESHKRTRAAGSRSRRRQAKDTATKLSEDTLAELDKEVEAKVTAELGSPDVQRRLEERLVAERARLEAAVEAKIAAERRLQLLRKRKEQEQRLKEQAELERILEENSKLLARAKARPTAGVTADVDSAAAEKMQSLVSVAASKQGGSMGDDVYVLGAAAATTVAQQSP